MNGNETGTVNLFIYVTWDDDVISRDNYIMMSKQQPLWIRDLGIQNFFKTSENRPRVSEGTGWDEH